MNQFSQHSYPPPWREEFDEEFIRRGWSKGSTTSCEGTSLTPDKMYPSSGSSYGAGVLVFEHKTGMVRAAITAAKIGRGSMCPRCFSSDGYGLLQDKVCAFCAYAGDGRDPAKDFLGTRVP